MKKNYGRPKGRWWNYSGLQGQGSEGELRKTEEEYLESVLPSFPPSLSASLSATALAPDRGHTADYAQWTRPASSVL